MRDLSKPRQEVQQPTHRFILGGMAESGAARVVGCICDLATGRVNLV